MKVHRVSSLCLLLTAASLLQASSHAQGIVIHDSPRCLSIDLNSFLASKTSFPSLNSYETKHLEAAASQTKQTKKESPSTLERKVPVVVAETKQQTDGDIYPGLRMVAEVVNLIKQKAYRIVNFKQFIEEALKNAVPFCDSHSSFFTSKSFIETKETTSGKYPGIGVSVISKAPTDDDLLITDVIEDGPSHKAGLKAGDKIVEVQGEKLRGLSSDEVISKLKGPAKSTVKVKIIRNKELLEFTITRDVIKNEVATAYYFPTQKVYYISLRLFTENAAHNVAAILEKVNNKECEGMVLDLRRNPGGILESGIEMAALFIDKGSLVVATKDRNHKVVSEYKTMSEPLLQYDIPIFLLIDNFSASASEILAGCLRYYSNQIRKSGKQLSIFLLGTQTFGKGSVQEVIPISNNCALKLTTMLYYLPNNESIQATGIAPDFVVKPRTIPEDEIKWINEFSGRETSLHHHITRDEVDHPLTQQPYDDEKRSHKKITPEESWDIKRIKSLTQDNQLQAAINMINMLNIARSCAPDKVNTRQKAIEFLKKNYVTDDPVAVSKVK